MAESKGCSCSSAACCFPASDEQGRKTTSRVTFQDLWGNFLARIGIGRNRHRVNPGLYRLGDPGREAPVLVTANYKMSFDHLRSRLPGRDAWILVLDTKGVNVWCAAGKGTFGTKELVSRLSVTGLEGVVEHRTLILPQLGAVGVAAHEVFGKTGFRVVYGPVRADDLPRFLDNGMKKDAEMRKVEFPAADRLILTSVELMRALGFYLPAMAALLAAAWLLRPALDRIATFEVVSLGGAVFIGTVLFPWALPILPFRPFSAKGAVLGAIWSAVMVLVFRLRPAEALGALLVLTPLVSFLSVNFTGSTTFTTLSGVKRELSVAIPAFIVSAGIGVALKVLAGLRLV